VGLGPLKVADYTEALEAHAPRLLEMRAKSRPLGTARVKLELTPRAGGTMVEMSENPDGPTAVLTVNPLVHLLTKGRNAESLMRLEELALRAEARREEP
jgi:hypothetical protein